MTKVFPSTLPSPSREIWNCFISTDVICFNNMFPLPNTNMWDHSIWILSVHGSVHSPGSQYQRASAGWSTVFNEHRHRLAIQLATPSLKGLFHLAPSVGAFPPPLIYSQLRYLLSLSLQRLARTGSLTLRPANNKPLKFKLSRSHVASSSLRCCRQSAPAFGAAGSQQFRLRYNYTCTSYAKWLLCQFVTVRERSVSSNTSAFCTRASCRWISKPPLSLQRKMYTAGENTV